jgi:hypothetical protein
MQPSRVTIYVNHDTYLMIAVCVCSKHVVNLH